MSNYINNNYPEIDPDRAFWLSQLLPRVQLAKAGQIVVSIKEQGIIGTTALDTCWGIIFYDRQNKFGMVGHALPSSKQLH